METSHTAIIDRELGMDVALRPVETGRCIGASAPAAPPQAVFARIAPASPPDDPQDLMTMLVAARHQARQLEQQLEETRRALAEEIAKRQRVERKLGSYEEHLAELEQVLELL